MFVEDGDFLPDINIHNDMKNFIVINYGSKLYIKINTGHVDQLVVLSLK